MALNASECCALLGPAGASLWIVVWEFLVFRHSALEEQLKVHVGELGASWGGFRRPWQQTQPKLREDIKTVLNERRVEASYVASQAHFRSHLHSSQDIAGACRRRCAERLGLQTARVAFAGWRAE